MRHAQAILPKSTGARSCSAWRNTSSRFSATSTSTESSSDVLALVRPIDQQGHNETARRLLQIIAQVYRYALIVGRAERNPANDLSGALRPRRVTHRAAVTEPKKVGQLLRNIDNYDGYFPIICSLRLAPLVFVRPTELRAAVWSEFDP